MNKFFILFIFFQLACIILAKPLEKQSDDIQIVNQLKTNLVVKSFNYKEANDDNYNKQLKRQRRSPGFWSFLCGRLKNCQ